MMKNKMKGVLHPKNQISTKIFVECDLVLKPDLLIALLIREYASKHIIISDKNVFNIHGENLIKILKGAGLKVIPCVVEPGEESKSLTVFEKLVCKVLKAGIDKQSYVITLGGGMINNLGGFVASTIYRGIRLIHLPSSLLAQVDAAIDYKQALNHKFGKNLIGSYYSPCKVLVDPKLLLTLPKRHLKNGMAESIKHALTQSNSFYDFLDCNSGRFDKIDILEEVVKETIKLKLALMNSDNFEKHGDFLLQYGHCIGHALECASKYDILHGEAITIGMCVSATIGNIKRICDNIIVKQHYSICSKYDLPVSLPKNITVRDMLKYIPYDKNRIIDQTRFSVIKRIGQAIVSKEGAFITFTTKELEHYLLETIKINHKFELCIK